MSSGLGTWPCVMVRGMHRDWKKKNDYSSFSEFIWCGSSKRIRTSIEMTKLNERWWNRPNRVGLFSVSLTNKWWLRSELMVFILRDGLGGFANSPSPFINFPLKKPYDFAKVPVISFESHSYWTVVSAVALRWHLSNMNVIFNRWTVSWQCWEIGKITERRKLAKLHTAQR